MFAIRPFLNPERPPPKLSEQQLHDLERELSIIFNEVRGDLGARDERYIRSLLATQRQLSWLGRIAILCSLLFLPGNLLGAPFAFIALMSLGVGALALAKILENMEIGHNLMHGQWDWLRDPQINSSTWEWDNVCPAALWRHSHNEVHHTWTNVMGMDRDLGYGPLRVSAEQTWHPGHVVQSLYNLLLAAFFEWGWAMNDVRFARIRRGEVPIEHARAQLEQIARKASRQLAKDYVFWPLLAGPFFAYVLIANFAANLIRNLWAHMIIFCGHFPAGVSVFTPAQIANETAGEWYVRQVLGSCNIEGGRLFHILSGNLGHQIEHHLFPTLPSNRYREIAPRIRDLCGRYGLPYHTGSLTRQFGTTMFKIFALSLPVRARRSPQP